ncbi:MAG TPA: protease inhibitor I9 family protein, partial [Casimicrobiaceae bacterium]
MDRKGKLRAVYTGVVAACLFFSPLASASNDEANTPLSAASAKQFSNNHYIVRLTEEPLVAYTGGVSGYAATKPARGSKIDPNNPNVARYAGYLDGRHSDVLARVGGRKIYDYHYSFNGFSAELTAAQADALRSVPGVMSVQKDTVVLMDTSSTPA